MTFRQFLAERGTPQFSTTGFGRVAGRLGESPTKPGKPQTVAPKMVPDLPKTDGVRAPHKQRVKPPVNSRPVRVRGVV